MVHHSAQPAASICYTTWYIKSAVFNSHLIWDQQS